MFLICFASIKLLVEIVMERLQVLSSLVDKIERKKKQGIRLARSKMIDDQRKEKQSSLPTQQNCCDRNLCKIPRSVGARDYLLTINFLSFFSTVSMNLVGFHTDGDDDSSA